MMQTASYYQAPLAVKQTISMGDATRASVNHLVAGAFTTPCSTAAHAFMQIVPPLSRFQVALDLLMPMLDSSAEVSQSPDRARQDLTARLSNTAHPTHTRVLYIVLIIRATSDCHQSFQVCALRDVREGT